MLESIVINAICGLVGGFLGACVYDKIKERRAKKCPQLPRGVLTIDPGAPPSPPPDPPQRPK